jgi:hypothetical protein
MTSMQDIIYVMFTPFRNATERLGELPQDAKSGAIRERECGRKLFIRTELAA